MRHHYIPAGLVKEWKTPLAAELVRADQRERAARHDKMILGVPNKYRKWPICVLSKEERRLVRATPDLTFCVEDFYTFPKFEDPRHQAVAWLTLAPEEEKRGLEFEGRDAVWDLAKRYQAGNLQRAEESLAAELDGPTLSVLRALREGARPSTPHRHQLEQFVAMSWFRSPSWHRSQFPGLVARSLAKTRAQFLAPMSALVGPDLAEEVAVAFDHVLEQVMYPLVLQRQTRQKRNPLRPAHPKLVLLEARAPAAFVLGDNPARAWRPDRTTPCWMARDPRPGLQDERAAITFPISPKHCLLLRNEPGAPTFRHEVIDEERVRIINTVQLVYAVEAVVLPSPHIDWFVPGLDALAVPPWEEPLDEPELDEAVRLTVS